MQPAQAGLPDFPACAGRALPEFGAGGATLRRASADDLPFLRELYAHARAAELAQVCWPPGVCEQFLDSQFALQHRHYVQHYSDADFLLVERHGKCVGRLYVSPAPPDHLIVDITLLEQARGHGLGSALITGVQRCAQAQGCGVVLHVDVRNAGAQRLYQRLGFVPLSVDGAYWTMRWSPLS